EQTLIFQQTMTIAKWAVQIGPPGVGAGAGRPVAILPADLPDATRRPQHAATRGAAQLGPSRVRPEPHRQTLWLSSAARLAPETASSSSALRVGRGGEGAQGCARASVALGARQRPWGCSPARQT